MPLTYTVPEAAALLGIGRSTAYEAARTGELPTIRIGRRILVPVPAFTDLLAKAGRLQEGTLVGEDGWTRRGVGTVGDGDDG